MRWLLSTRENDGVTIVDISIASTFISETSHDLRQTIEVLLESGKKNILLNLASVQFTDSSGLGDFISCYNKARDRSSKLKLLNPQAKVKEVLSITKLATVFEIFHNEEEAITSFQS
jgi:anti-sigma B factor antagonist